MLKLCAGEAVKARAQSVTQPKARLNLWLGTARYDVGLFQISAILALVLILPYKFFGPSVVLPIYGAYMLIFGLPHNYLTWASTLPQSTRQGLNWELVIGSVVAAFAICALIPFSKGSS